MNPERLRVVLADSVKEHDLLVVADANKWWNEDRFAAEGDKPFEAVYSTKDGESKIHWIEDKRIGVNYILVKGKDAKEAKRIVGILEDEVAYYSSENIMKRARDAKVVGDRRRGALYHLALDKMEHGFDKETFDIFKKALADKDPIVRGAAVTGTIYLGWPELAEPLKTVADKSEPDESIRKDAALIASRLEQQPKKKKS